MNPYNDLSQHEPDCSTRISRVSSTFDFSKLFQQSEPSRDTDKSRRSRTSAVTDGSENSQILYMAAPKKSGRLNRSLSSITNGSGRELDGPADLRTDYEDDLSAEKASWNVIDREIIEWEYLCQTGRPYWWSLDSKHSRPQRLQQSLLTRPSPRLGLRELGDGHEPTYDIQRRAASDSYLTDPSPVQNLAFLVAVQLLGACFTLPPDHVTRLTSPNYGMFDKDGSTYFPDPRMISSLRMHTQFRFSPSFGHQARNTSPVQSWPWTHDGPSPNSSRPCIGTPTQTPVTAAVSESSTRRRRVHRMLSVSDSTSSSSSFSSQPDDFSRSRETHDQGLRAVGSRLRRRRQIDDAKYGEAVSQCLPGDGKRSSQHMTAKYPRYQPPTTPRAFTKEEETDTSQAHFGVHRSQSSRTNYSLQPMIRSEPHLVFVQPVRELVIKRWRTFRRRFGGSLHSALPTDEDLISARSESGRSGSSSPALSSDGRARRLCAQERGDIHSSSDSTMHYNSPASGYFTPNDGPASVPSWIDSGKPSPIFELANPLAAAALVAAEGGSPTKPGHNSGMELSHPSPSLETSSPPINLCQAPAEPNSAKSGPKSHDSRSLLIHKASSSSGSHCATRKAQKRQRRQSMLSEVCTPDDFHVGVAADAECHVEPVDRSVLSAVGSALATPQEVVQAPLFTPSRPLLHETVSSPGPAGNRLMEFKVKVRPILVRTSTSGTQIFSPSDDGVELDGLPVGPDEGIWSGKDKRRERTYL